MTDEKAADNRFFESVLDMMPDPTALMDERGEVTYVNSAYARLFGVTREELVGKSFLFFVPMADEIKERVMAEFVRELREELFTQFETFVPRGSGAGVWAKINASYIESEGRKVCVATLHDISDRRKIEDGLRKSGEKLRNIFQSVSDGIIVTDLDGKVTEVNQRALQITGHTSGREVLGTNLLQLVELDQEAVLGALRTAVKAGTVRGVELTARRKNGARFFLELSASIFRAATDEPEGYIVMLRDITERRLAGERIRASEERLRDLFDSANDLIQTVDPSGRYLYVNQKWLKTLGYTEDEAASLQVRDVVRPDRLEDCLGVMKKVAEGESFDSIETVFVTRDGRDVYVEGNTSGRFENDRFAESRGTFRDVSERRRAEELYQRLVQNAPFGIYILVDGRFVFVNPVFESITGYASAELLARESLTLIHPEDRAAVREHAVRRLKGERLSSQREFRILRKDGQIRWAIETVVSINYGGKRATLGNFVDITERREAELRLRDSEERFRTLVNNLPGVTYRCLYDPGWTMLFMSNQIRALSGYHASDFINNAVRTYASIIHPDDVKMVDDAIRAAVDKKEPYSLEYRITNATGEARWVFERGQAFYDETGGVLWLDGAIFDVTQRRQAEIKLQESQERFSELARMLPLGVWETDARGRYTYFNDHIKEALGYTAEQLMGESLWRTVAKEDREWLIAKTIEYVGAGKPMPGLEHRVLRKDGSTYPVIAYSTPIIRDGKVTGSRGLTVDVSQLKAMEVQLKEKLEELQQANERLKELDRLKDNFLSTVSHELRTPLTSIKSFAEILLAYEEDRATQTEFLGIINEEADRLTRLINDFLDLSKIQSGRVVWKTAGVSMAWVIERAITATSALFSATNLDLVTDVATDLPAVMADQDRLVQVLTNLLGNAQKFTPSGGKVSLAARLTVGDGTPSKPDMVLVSVADSGIGIAPENHRRIFEKFGQIGDTLKDRPKGTGLGLPISKEIIEHYGGRIWVESELGKGSTFLFTLPVPRATETAPAAPVAPAQRQPMAVGIGGTTKTILVVDDEAHIRRFITHELSARGFNCIEAGGGKQAVDLARQSHPHLITLDINMPDIDGFDVTAILKNDPLTQDIPILIVSVLEERARADRVGVSDYLTKPFSIEALLDKVTRLLTGESKTILIVDDDVSLVRSLDFELKKRGFNTGTAFDGKEAMALIEKRQPDLLLLDINMPEMDGYEVIRAVKGNPKTASLRIVVITGIDIDDVKARAPSAGADEYLAKGSSFSKLFETIGRILGGTAEKPPDESSAR